jgi:hypothetical protein
MAELTNAQLVAYSNQVLRPAADVIARLDKHLVPIRAEYDAKNLGSVIEAGGAGEMIADGSTTDGRTRVTGGDIYNLITLIDALKTFMDASGRRSVVAKWQVNGLRD